MQESLATQLVKCYDGNVLIRSNGFEYSDTRENFKLDSGEDFPVPPMGCIGESYIPDVKHRCTDGRKATQLPMPWRKGNALLAQAESLVAAKVARETPPPAPPLTDDEVIDQLENLSKAMKAFLLLYAEREGVTPAQLRNAIKAKMATLP
jgi:hypothetical protein